MTVVAVATALIDEGESAVTLARYFQLAGYSECAGFGVNDGTADEPCRRIWTQPQRAVMAKYLREAQDEIEQVTGYPLAPRWIANEQQYFGCLVHARWTKVIEAGVKAETDIQLSALVDHSTDPAVIGPIATTVTDPDEVHIFHPGTDAEIMPSEITISGGFLTIEIPRCRLVTEAAQDNDESGIDYNDVGSCATSVVVQGSFECFVDVIRVYNDPSTQATLVWPHRSTSSCDCSCSSCDGFCGEYTHDACEYVRNGKTGAIDLRRANYAAGEWTAECSHCYCSQPELARLNYRAGLTHLTYQAEDAIVRLAHAKMPNAPCGCGPISEMWARDRTIPDVLTRERENCPFGQQDGSWISWRFANAMTQHRISVM